MSDPWLNPNVRESATWHSLRGSPSFHPTPPTLPPPSQSSSSSPFLLNLFSLSTSSSTLHTPHDLSRQHSLPSCPPPPPPPSSKPSPTSSPSPSSPSRWSQQHPPPSYSLARTTPLEDLSLSPPPPPHFLSSGHQTTKRRSHVALGERSDQSCNMNENLLCPKSMPHGAPVEVMGRGRLSGGRRRREGHVGNAADLATCQPQTAGGVSGGSPSSATSALTDSSERTNLVGALTSSADVARSSVCQLESSTQELTLPPPCCTRMCVYFSLPCAKRQRRSMAAGGPVLTSSPDVARVTSTRSCPVEPSGWTNSWQTDRGRSDGRPVISAEEAAEISMMSFGRVGERDVHQLAESVNDGLEASWKPSLKESNCLRVSNLRFSRDKGSRNFDTSRELEKLGIFKKPIMETPPPLDLDLRL